GVGPAGIVEMGGLLRQQVASGKTVFISSHVMAEVQQICDRVAIINLGELVRVALVADLLAGHGEFVVKVDDPAAALTLIQGHEWGRSARLEDGVVGTPSPPGRGRELLQVLGAAGIWPRRLRRRRPDLQASFPSPARNNDGGVK